MGKKLVVVIILVLILFFFAREKMTSKLDRLISQVKTGNFHYTHWPDGCIIGLGLEPKKLTLMPEKPCRESTLKEKLLILPVSDCGGPCDARENALSCLYDMKASIKNNPKVIAALKNLIASGKPDYFGEKTCLQRSNAIGLLGEVGGKPEEAFLKDFIERQGKCRERTSPECDATNIALKKLGNN
jgi:hypothetical protein